MAEKYFSAALRQVKLISDGSVVSDKWESLLNNLGHTSRKLGRFEEALAYHRQALVLKPQTASTYSAIGYVQTLQVILFFLCRNPNKKKSFVTFCCFENGLA
jgi:anaphase-promoting complex subunit 6